MPLDGLTEHIASRVGEHANRLILHQVFDDRIVFEATTHETYRAALIRESAKMQQAGFTPVLLVHSRRHPAWINRWIEESNETGSAGAIGDSCVGVVEGVEVYRSRWPAAGASILVARERLKQVVYEENEQGRIVAVSVEPDENDPWKVDLLFEFGQNVALADSEPVVLTFSASET